MTLSDFADLTKNLELMRLSWIIHIGSKCTRQYSDKIRMEGDLLTEEKVI